MEQKDLFGVLYVSKSSGDSNNKAEQRYFKKLGIETITNKLFEDKNIWRIQYVYNGSFAIVFSQKSKDAYPLERFIAIGGSAQEILSYNTRISHLYGNWYYTEGIVEDD